MLAKALGVQLNLKPLNLGDKEHLTPEFLKINPQHTIPTLVDNNFAIWESRAILGYLADKYGKDDSLYPKDAQKRAVVNQRLFFDIGTLYKSFGDYYSAIKMKLPLDPEKFKKFEEAVGFLDGFLKSGKYVAGDNITIADYAFVVTVSTFIVAEYDYSRFTNITRWYDQCQSTLSGKKKN